MKPITSLDIDWLRAFVTVADTRSFTTSGAALAAAQSTISVRIRKLEQRLKQRLMERNSRDVVLTPSGADFLPDARMILQKHDEAAMRAMGGQKKRSLEIAISDHAAGALLPGILSSLHRERSDRHLLVTVGSSEELFKAFAGGKFDIVIGRDDEVGGDGRIVLRDKLSWTASKAFCWDVREPLPFISLAAPCSIRDIALLALSAKGIAWRSVFVGTGVAAVQAAASAGLGVACLETRNVPPDCGVLGVRSGLPHLPRTQIVMRTRLRTADEESMAAAIATAVKTAAEHTSRHLRPR
jgi:DNA-binding transcriptional LysR family regulator